jgi:hypothetical protein
MMNKLDVNSNPLISESLDPAFYLIKNSPKTFEVKKGTWEISKPVVLHGDLVVSEGSVLKFSPDSFLIVKGNLRIDGTEESPVVLASDESEQSWGGVYVYSDSSKKAQVKINNVVIKNTKRLSANLLQLTGALTFYNAEVFAKNIVIENTTAEDALNIIHSSISINNLEVLNAYSDAFDCDFCVGFSNEMRFEEIGGDGFDVSGSRVDATVKYADGVVDKIFSIGEKSDVNISLDEAKNCSVVIAVKDASLAKADITNSYCEGPSVLTYVKKDFYEGQTSASVKFSGDLVPDTNRFLAARGTKLVVNGKPIKTVPLDVAGLYKFGSMRKLDLFDGIGGNVGKVISSP